MIGLESIDAALAIRVASVVLAAHVMLISAEHLVTRDRFDDGNVLSWKVSKLHVRGSKLTAAMEPLLRPPRFRWLLGLQFIAGATLAASAIFWQASAVALFVIVLVDVGIAIRHQWGLSGDYHMSLVVAVGLFVATLFPAGSRLQFVGLLFIAVQSILSYFIAGVSKLVSEQWLSGEAPVGVLSTDAWGYVPLYEFLSARPRAAKAVSWSVILFECLFPVVLVAQLPVALGVVGGGVLFHSANAAVMRLNGFFLAFGASYPAVLYLNGVVREALLSGWGFTVLP
jgi:hypothetical protein